MYQQYINGRCVAGDGTQLDVISPVTGELLASMQSASIAQADEALAAAQAAFHDWSHESLNTRIGWMMKLKAACQNEQEKLIRLMAMEGGKSLKEASNDFRSFLNYFDYYAEEGRRQTGTILTEGSSCSDAMHLVVKRPVGVVVGHLAWNMPLSNVGLKLCPAMVSGCTCVLKPSVETPLASLYVGALCEQIGMPKGVVNIICGPSAVIGNHLSQSRIPALISVIGSTAVGVEVMKNAATSIKRFSMELGGNAPCIILPDAELDRAAKFVANRKTRISGQGCANINRIFVHESIHDAFVQALVQYVSAIRVGWGDDMPDAMGPMINCKARDRMLGLVAEAVSEGAQLVYGGVIPELPPHLQKGAYFVPAVLDNVTDQMSIANQEIFGPIYSILTFRDVDEVIARANATPLGLSGYLFTHDSRIIGTCISELDVGELQINYPVFAAPNLPHIGIKQSGIGCDRGKWSLDEYYEIRRISMQG